MEKTQLDNATKTNRYCAQLFDQPAGGRGRTPGCEHVVQDQHPLAWLERIGVHLEGVGTVLQLVSYRKHLERQLACFAYRHEARTEAVGNWGGNYEAPRLDPEHLVDALTGKPVGQ